MNELNEDDNNLIKFNDSDVIDSDEISILRRQITQLTTENDNYKQEIHLLQGKLSASVTVQNELLENIDSLEESLKKNNELVDQKIRQVETKHGIKIKELIDRINELENELLFQTNKINDVQGKLNEANDKLLLATNSTINSTFSKVDDQDSDEKVNELVQLLADEENKSLKLEHALKELEQDMFEIREAYETTKEQLKEKSSVLEETRDELAECRSELMSLRATPSDQQSKGNSLFAEVEDRRKKSMDTITKLKQSFFDAKKALNVKEAEIKALKAEKAALLTTIEDDKDDTIQQNANLIEKYKDRISELEVKLKDQQKKFWLLEKQKYPVGDEFIYFENMLSAKKKEIEELSAKLENKSIQTLIEEEIKCQTNQQLRYWRRKATTKEAQLEAIKCRLETDSSAINSELLKLIKPTDKPDSCLYNEETNSSITVKIADSTLDNTQRLIEIPKLHKEMNAEKKVEGFASVIDKPKPLDSDLIDFTESATKNTNKVNEIENSICILSDKNHVEKRGILKSTKEVWNIVSSSSSILSQSTSTSLGKNNGKENKSIRFSEDTVDPMSKKLTKQTNITPKYPIIYAPSKSKNEK